ncbi:MAG: hypothetical protein U5M51_11220 [Emticicia sp.]|nr:hypothetical protein [Emticicia sp.]
MIRQLLLALMFLSWAGVSAQRIYGSVKSDTKEPLQVSIYIKDLGDKDLINEFYQSNEDGSFDFRVQNFTPKIIIEVRAMGYAAYVDSIVNVVQNQSYLLDIILKPEAIELESVVISSTRTVVVKKDTVDYYPKAFLNGTERKVEDLIKRLPGMEVSENGRIKYLGKVVESVQLDGDDLFGDRYNVGTKNIAVDLVEKVQAIDNFTANPLLKGLVNSETVSLNIVLKKTKTNFNSDANIGVGVGSKNKFRRDLGLNVLAFNNRIKSFGNFTHNNIGNNSYNNDYNVYKAEQYGVEVVPQMAQKLLPDNNISSAINTTNARLNDEYSGSYNFLSRLSKKVLFKSNAYFLQDKLSKEETNIIDFINDGIVYDDQTKSQNKPQSKQISAKLEYSINTKNLLNLETIFSRERISQNSNSIQNQKFAINNMLSSGSKYWLNKLIFTHKIDINSALQYKSYFTKSNNIQDLSINAQSLAFIGDNQMTNNQLLDFQNHLLYFRKIKETKLNISAGNTFAQTAFSSALLNRKKPVSAFSNDYKFSSSLTYLNFQLDIEKNNWRFSPDLKLAKFENKLNYFIEEKLAERKNFVVMPKVLLSFQPNLLHKFSFSGDVSYVPVTTKNLHLYSILEGNRAISKNLLNLDLQKTEQLNLNYRHHKPFEFFTIFFGFYLKRDFNTFLSNIMYDDNFTTTTYFRVPTNIVNKGVNFNLDKLVTVLRTSFKYSGSFGQMNYKNVVNNSEIRDNISQNQSHSLFIKTGFSLPIGFENNFSIDKNKFVVNGQNSNVLISHENKFKFLYKPNDRLLLISTFRTFTPQIRKTSFSFLDFELNYKPKQKPKSKIIEYRLIGNNLLDTNFFKTTENSDFTVINYQTNLIGRYIMSSVLLRF